MPVDPSHAAATTTIDGVTWYFCSIQCHEEFEVTRAAGPAAARAAANGTPA